MSNVIGHFIYKGCLISQHDDISIPFKKLFDNIKPSRVIEIGTFAGGLTHIIRDELDGLGLNNTEVRTYDVLDYDYPKSVNVDYRIEDLFNWDQPEIDPNCELVKYIQQPGVTIVLCDGGNKINEFNVLSDYIKNGDIIMAHDYAPNQEYFNEFIYKKIWLWLEIQDSSVESSVLKNNLKPYMVKEFTNVVWLCKIKE